MDALREPRNGIVIVDVGVKAVEVAGRAVGRHGHVRGRVVVLGPERAQPLLLLGERVDHVEVRDAVVVAAVAVQPAVFAAQNHDLGRVFRVIIVGKVVIPHDDNVGVVQVNERRILKAGICRQIVIVIIPVLFAIATIKFR